MLSVDDALSRITGALAALPAETIDLADAAGRVLAEDIVSQHTQPPVAMSSMDGYAVRAQDAGAPPVTLEVIGEAPAGGAFEGTVGPGQAVRIFTGGPMPDGANAVIMQEDTDRDGSAVTIKETAYEGKFTRAAGLDFNLGDPGPRAGSLLTPRVIALVAAMNVPQVSVRRRPKVALLANGDELVRPGQALGPTQIISSNSNALDSLRELAAKAEGADMLITLGGASVGDHDLVQEALAEKGLDVNFWKIAMRPGKPLIFGKFGEIPMVGLPGNPVSALVCGLIFVVPAVRKMLGQDPGPITRCNAVLDGPLPANGGREAYLRGDLKQREDGTLIATPFNLQDSSVLSGFADAGCLVVQPPNGAAMDAGGTVQVIPLPTLLTNI
jgi:molybdopterin molybdotransferase